MDARPRSLQGVVLLGMKHGGTGSFLREFLDEFYMEEDSTVLEGMLDEEPPLSTNERLNAYVAAVAEYLALRYKLKIPSWVHEEHRFLKSPDFPWGLESLKATFIMESPASFRKRLIFVPSDPLYRPRRKEGPNHGAT